MSGFALLVYDKYNVRIGIVDLRLPILNKINYKENNLLSEQAKILIEELNKLILQKE